MAEGADAGIRPCGLGARDVLRLEMGYPLYGQDLSGDRTALEAGLGWTVSFDKGGFRGRDALLRQRDRGVPRRLRGLVMEERRHIPRAHCPVLTVGHKPSSSAEARSGEAKQPTASAAQI